MWRLLNNNRPTFTWPYTLILDRFGGNPHKGSKYKFNPYFLAVNISFHVLDISRFQKVGVGEMCVCAGGGGGCTMGGLAHALRYMRWLKLTFVRGEFKSFINEMIGVYSTFVHI